MGWNNTLTNAQLEAMFSTTDEEMWYIEKTLGGLIEYLKNPTQMWKRCTRLFSNEAVLK